MAISQPSTTEWRAMLLVAERLDRIEAWPAQRGGHGEDDADRHTQAQRHGHGPEGYPRRQRRSELHERRESGTREETGDTSQERQHDRLRQELTPDVPPGRPE